MFRINRTALAIALALPWAASAQTPAQAGPPLRPQPRRRSGSRP